MKRWIKNRSYIQWGLFYFIFLFGTFFSYSEHLMNRFYDSSTKHEKKYENNSAHCWREKYVCTALCVACQWNGFLLFYCDSSRGLKMGNSLLPPQAIQRLQNGGFFNFNNAADKKTGRFMLVFFLLKYAAW